jgi:hypothetical protein
MRKRVKVKAKSVTGQDGCISEKRVEFQATLVENLQKSSHGPERNVAVESISRPGANETRQRERGKNKKPLIVNEILIYISYNNVERLRHDTGEWT